MIKRDGYMLPSWGTSSGVDFSSLEQVAELIEELGLSYKVVGQYLLDRVEGDTLSDHGFSDKFRDEIVREMAEYEADGGENYGERVRNFMDKFEDFKDSELVAEMKYYEDAFKDTLEKANIWIINQAIVKDE